MSEPTHIRNLKKYGSGDPTQQNIRAVEAEMYSGPDRGAALVLGALAERALEKLLRRGMRDSGVNELFDFGAPIGTFYAKIQVAFAFRLLGQTTRHDLNLIRHVRNQFAHSRQPIRFTTPEVRAVCDQFRLPDLPGVHLSFRMLNAVSHRRLRAASDSTHPRTRYFTACNEIAQRIYFIRTGDEADPLNQLP